VGYVEEDDLVFLGRRLLLELARITSMFFGGIFGFV
jgi:hypothetical protein